MSALPIFTVPTEFLSVAAKGRDQAKLIRGYVDRGERDTFERGVLNEDTS
ncbi:hypothetical protein RAZWK3B_05302 [Roseobacter sp. AzwK-3b]|nr:hypothetical protein RAZWK3B_05302 [Roseobacter sp. AzwK-3b]